MWLSEGPIINMVSKIQLVKSTTNKYYILIYNLLIAYAIVNYVLPSIRREHVFIDTIKKGIPLALIVYGILVFRCAGLFKNYFWISEFAFGIFSTIFTIYFVKKIEIKLLDIV